MVSLYMVLSYCGKEMGGGRSEDTKSQIYKISKPKELSTT